MDNRLLKVNDFFSFKPDSSSSDYQLIKVNHSVVDKLIYYYNQIENNDNYTICLRGDSKNKSSSHDSFFNIELARLFIVGKKAKNNITQSSSSSYNSFLNNIQSQLLTDIHDLIREINIEIIARPADHNIRGVIPDSFLESLVSSNNEELQKWKIFFLSFLHNSGRNKNFSGISPFISLTYGYKKYVTARSFALKRSKTGKGIVFLYYIKDNWPYQVKSKFLTKKLKEFDVKWYNDINSEIMLINGMYPHYLLGIFEVEKYSNPRFIINPWLYKMIIENDKFKISAGIKIDQMNFRNFALKSGYKYYFFNHIDETNQYISSINQFQYIKTPKPPQGV